MIAYEDNIIVKFELGRQFKGRTYFDLDSDSVTLPLRRQTITRIQHIANTNFKNKQIDHEIRNREFFKQNRNIHIVWLDLYI